MEELENAQIKLAALADCKTQLCRISSETKALSPAAKRALEEAEARRELRECKSNPLALEVNGQKGLDPVRYGDWEKNGLISDF